MRSSRSSETDELLRLEEWDAWHEYLHETKGHDAARYREVEEWAWSRLTERLRALAKRRSKIAV